MAIYTYSAQTYKNGPWVWLDKDNNELFRIDNNGDIFRLGASFLGEVTTGNITLSISNTGSDTSTINRPSILSEGDHTSYPFLTIQAAINSIPKNLLHKVIIDINAGIFDGFTIQGLVGGQLEDPDGTQDRNIGLFIRGHFILSTLTSGPNNGTAPFGSISTQINTPGSNWTANNLIGRFIRIDSGGGSSSDSSNPTYRPILTNTTTYFTFDPILGVDNTTVFSIVDIDTFINSNIDTSFDSNFLCIDVYNNIAPIKLSGLSILSSTRNYGIYSRKNNLLEVEACKLIASLINTLDSSLDIDYRIKNCLLSGANAITRKSLVVIAENLFLQNGALDFRLAQDVYCWSTAKSCVLNALILKQCLHASVSLSANSGSATPLLLESILQFDLVGNGLTGSSNIGYGIDIQNGGRYDITGATITGTLGDVNVEDSLQSYTELSTYKTIIKGGTALVVQA